MTRILFVCLGNICRSPTAEAIFREKVRQYGMEQQYEIDSAGILDAHAGEPADARMRQHAEKRGLLLTSISRPLTPEDFATFDCIIGMDEQNRQDLLDRAPAGTAHKISLLLEECSDADLREVPDPYYGGPAGFETVLDLVDTACEALLNRLSPAR